MADSSKQPSRRDCHVLVASATSAAVCALLATAFTTRAMAGPGPARHRAQQWTRQLHAMCLAVKAGTLSPNAWQDQIEALHRSIAMDELMRFIDFKALIRGLTYPDDRGAIRPIRLPQVPGIPARPSFAGKIFAYKKGAGTPPHGHHGMVSAHLVLRGALRVRTYERVAEATDHLVVTPAKDLIAKPGQTISMSDERDNVHWFEAVSQHAYTLDIPISGLYRNKSYVAPANRYGMIYVDPRGPANGRGKIRAPIIGFEQAMAEFGPAS